MRNYSFRLVDGVTSSKTLVILFFLATELCFFPCGRYEGVRHGVLALCSVKPHVYAVSEC